MNTLIAFPDWVPWWVPMVLLVPALLYALAFLFMPFSVLGVKTRLEAIEGRLEDIQQELRHLAMRMPMGPQEVDFEDVYAPISQTQRRESRVNERPPIPPSARDGFGARKTYPAVSRDDHLPESRSDYDDDEAPQERPAPPPNARPGWRQEPHIVRHERSEPRFGPRR